MFIVNKITSILAAMKNDDDCALQSYQYNDLGTSNLKLDNKNPSPTAVFYQITDFVFDLKLGVKREKANIFVAFLDKEKKLDDDAISQDTIITNMSDLATEFIVKIIEDNSLRITNSEIKLKSVFLRSDSVRSGVQVELELEEKSGTCWK